MPIDWGPDVPINAFIACRIKHPKTKQAGSHTNNANIDPVKQARLAELDHAKTRSAVATSDLQAIREPYRIERILDTQKRLFNNWLEKKMLRKDWFMNGKDKLKATEEGRRQDAKYQRLSCYRKRRRLFKRSIKFGIQERNDVSESHPHRYGQG